MHTVIKVSVYIYVGCVMRKIGLYILFRQPYFFHSMTSPLHYLSFEFSIHGKLDPHEEKVQATLVNSEYYFQLSRFTFYYTNQTLAHDGFK